MQQPGDTSPTLEGTEIMAKLRHIAINCDDLEASAKFYTSAFDLEEIGRAGDILSMGAIYLTDGTVNVALIKIDQPDFPNAKPEGLNHIGFVVDDVHAAIAQVESVGAVSVSGPPPEGAPTTWETKMKTPDGVAFDLTAHGWPGIKL
jgi:catechol 2,3-dioxygenase-like lactoylglutathione lyase family enzyme